MKELTAILIVSPFVTAGMCFFIRTRLIRSLVVLASGFLLILSAFLLISRVPFSLSPQAVFGVNLHLVIQIADFLLLLVILYFGFRHGRLVIIVLAIFQMVTLCYLEFFLVTPDTNIRTFYCDNFALIMVLIISIAGSIICFQAIPYMQRHEQHLGLERSGQPRFFFVMLLFLGAMNGVVLSNDGTFFYFFFEMTTLCSFLLIGHDRTETATQNAVRALWVNSLGGAAFLVALVFVYTDLGTLDIQRIIASKPENGLYLMGLALFCFAAFTKSAQFPFQGWLLGAMVAPTPVSALLHSSTMVKVGVYLVLRISPAMKGLFLSECVAIFGAFVFLGAAALAVGQSNGKKVLAYSTISNLGLIFCCAGLNTHEAFTAGVLLIIFHAVVKALLFVCVGTIEQHIESRDIEDMRGLYNVMPLTALIAVMGVIMMIMPPFGLLLGKWMAMEAAANNLYVIIPIALGSALTVMYWARWAGTLMSDPFAGRFKLERHSLLTWGALGSLCLSAGALSVAAPWLYLRLFTSFLSPGYAPPYAVHEGILENSFGVFAVLPLCLIAALGFAVSIWSVRRASQARIVVPYLSGIHTQTAGEFRGAMNKLVHAEAKNYYLSSLFGEEKLTAWINLSAAVLLTLMVGGAI